MSIQENQMSIQEIARILENKTETSGNVSIKDLAKKLASPLILQEEQAPGTTKSGTPKAVNPIVDLMEAGRTAGNKMVLTEVVL